MENEKFIDIIVSEVKKQIAFNSQQILFSLKKALRKRVVNVKLDRTFTEKVVKWDDIVTFIRILTESITNSTK